MGSRTTDHGERPITIAHLEHVLRWAKTAPSSYYFKILLSILVRFHSILLVVNITLSNSWISINIDKILVLHPPTPLHSLILIFERAYLSYKTTGAFYRYSATTLGISASYCIGIIILVNLVSTMIQTRMLGWQSPVRCTLSVEGLPCDN